MLLDPRLQAVAEFVPPLARVADIGCDHAQLPIALLKSGRVASAIGIDKAAAPLELAKANARRLDSRIELRRGDGLAPLQPGEAECVTLAGLGGAAAVEILSATALTRVGVRRVILQVNKKLPTVRRHLLTLGWRCVGESVIRANKRFFVTCAFCSPETDNGPLETTLDPLDLLVGPFIRRQAGPIEDAYVRHLRRWLETVEGRVGESSPISAGVTVAMLRTMEAIRNTLA